MPHVAISLEELSLGGGPAFTLSLAEALTRRGHEVVIVAERAGLWWPELERRRLRGVLVPRARHHSIARQARRLARSFTALNVDAVILNASSDNLSAHFATHLLDARIGVIPIVHGPWPGLFKLLLQDVEVWNCAVGVSPEIESTLRRLFPGKSIRGINNGIDLPSPMELEERARFSQPLKLLFVGRLIDSHKGVLRLPIILGECRRRGVDVHLTVVGSGRDQVALAELAANEGVADAIEMRGALPPDEVAAIMRQHHVFVFPTNTEGMPLAVLEAQANGCVVVVTHLPGITDVIVEDGVSGLLAGPPDSGLVDRMIVAVTSLSDASRWAELSANGIARSKMLFSVERMGDAYSALIDDVVSGLLPLMESARFGARRSRGANRWPAGLLDHVPPVLLSPETILRLRKLRGKIERFVRQYRVGA